VNRLGERVGSGWFVLGDRQLMHRRGIRSMKNQASGNTVGSCSGQSKERSTAVFVCS
jgi:hypothetical protein